MVSRRRSSVFLAVAALLAIAVGCGNQEADLANGKRLYVGDVPKDYKKTNANYQPCAACHGLARADIAGGSGPNLDSAFAQARKDGMSAATVQGVVHDQINSPRRSSQMPADLVSGDDARDVAAYVAAVAGQPGKDQGQLATIGGAASNEPIAAKNGVLNMPADETGRTLFASTQATAEAGKLELVMANPSPLQHNIAIKGGVIGPIVGTGGTSQFTDTFTPGKYQYICTVPGHEAGGMKGTLTVE